MKTSDVPPARPRTAIALSIAVHVCALWLLALLDEQHELLADERDGASPREFAFTTITRRPVAAPALRFAPAPRQTAIPRRLQRADIPPARPERPASVPAAEPVARLAAAGILPAVRRMPHSPATHAPGSVVLVAPVTSAPATATPTPTTPTPAPTPEPAVSPPPAANFGGLFSQNYPPAVAEPGEVARLRARLSSPVHVRIEIDENGRAVEVRFVHPIDDPDIAAEVRTTLLAWRYVPADCNGLHCDGTLEITF